MAKYHSQLNLIRALSDVSASNTNRPIKELKDNTDYLKALLEDLSLSSSLMLYEQTVEADAVVGQPVYLDSATESYKRALAGATTEEGAVVPTEASRVVGLVFSKHNATKADILVGGVQALDLASAIDEDEVELGDYYLSGQTAGKLVKQSPPVSIPVCTALPGGLVLMRPGIARDILDTHSHYRFELTARPAGDHTPPDFGLPHEIANPDPELPGWLPADHEIFAGNAPEGAKFGYNLSAHPSLANLWPPIPISGAYLEMDRGEDPAQGLHGVPLGADKLAVIDRHGLWWMSDCYGDVPWPTEYDSSGSEDSEDSAESGECPRDLHFLLQLWFSRVQFATAKSVVTSLASLDERLKVRCALTGNPATAGALTLDLDLDLQVGDDTSDESGLAIKNVDDAGQFVLGPVVSKIKSGNSRMTLSGGSEDEDGYRYGKVTLTVSPLESLDLPVQLVRVDGVLQEFFPDLYLGFPASRASSYRGRIDVPTSLEVESASLKLRFWLLGRSAGTLPALTLEYRQLTRPSGAPVTIPSADSALSITTTEAVGANQYVEVESDVIEVAPGDTIFFTLSRAGSDGYAAEVGVVRQYGALALSG